MLLNQLNYYSHLILNSKYKFLFNIIVFILFIYIYNLYTNEIDFIECMKRSKPNLIEQIDLNRIEFLENENRTLRNYIQELETQLHSNKEEHYITKTTQQTNIESLEDTQNYLVNKISILQQQIIEANNTINEMAGDNVELRTNAVENQQSFERTLQDLDQAKQHCTDALQTLHRLTEAYDK